VSEGKFNNLPEKKGRKEDQLYCKNKKSFLVKERYCIINIVFKLFGRSLKIRQLGRVTQSRIKVLPGISFVVF